MFQKVPKQTKFYENVPILAVSDDTITLHYEGEAINSSHEDISLFDDHIITSGESASINHIRVVVSTLEMQSQIFW